MTTPSAGGEKFKDSLSVVIPTYKEARRLPATLRALELGARALEQLVGDEPGGDHHRQLRRDGHDPNPSTCGGGTWS